MLTGALSSIGFISNIYEIQIGIHINLFFYKIIFQHKIVTKSMTSGHKTKHQYMKTCSNTQRLWTTKSMPLRKSLQYESQQTSL